jgi:hypothetical protein
MNYYHIGYQGGGSGKFIATILMFLVEGIKRPMIFEGNDSHHAHYEWERYASNLNIDQFRSLNDTLIHFPIKYQPWKYLNFTTHKNYKNIYWPGGVILNYNSLLEKYPNFKQINITVNNQEALFVDINHYVKAHSSIVFSMEKYKWMLPNFKESLKLLSESQITELKSECVNYNDMDEAKLEKQYDELDDNLKKHIFHIKFFDIVNDPEKVLGILSTVANKPIHNRVREAYYNYIKICM